MDTIEMHISGMHCSGCAVGIQMLAEGMDGVGACFIDLDGKKGSFEIDPARITPDDIIAEIAKLGYEARPV